MNISYVMMLISLKKVIGHRVISAFSSSHLLKSRNLIRSQRIQVRSVDLNLIKSRRTPQNNVHHSSGRLFFLTWMMVNIRLSAIKTCFNYPSWSSTLKISACPTETIFWFEIYLQNSHFRFYKLWDFLIKPELFNNEFTSRISINAQVNSSSASDVSFL